MGMFEWVDPTREALQKYLRGRTDFAAELPGALYSLATDPKARRSALERAPKPFQMTDADMDAAMSFWNPGGLMAKIVYHGSPHKFDKFDASKIGTGEGAQAYGHGVYLADSEGVGKEYAKNLGGFSLVDKQGKEIDVSKLPNAARKFLREGNYFEMSVPEMVSELERAIAQSKSWDAQDVARGLAPSRAGLISEYESFAPALKSAQKLENKGSLYKADLPDEWIPKMLDWDKPLKDQPEHIQKLADSLGTSKELAGRALHNQAQLKVAGIGDSGTMAQDIARWFQKQGIPGIRYLDGGSRSAGQGSYNYVVFPGLEDQVKILERNGIPLEGMFKMDKK